MKRNRSHIDLEVAEMVGQFDNLGLKPGQYGLQLTISKVAVAGAV
jgi:hypothetical protein